MKFSDFNKTIATQVIKVSHAHVPTTPSPPKPINQDKIVIGCTIEPNDSKPNQNFHSKNNFLHKPNKLVLA